MGNSVMLNGNEYAGEQIAYKDSTYELVSKVYFCRKTIEFKQISLINFISK